MKGSHSTELLALLLASISGVLISLNHGVLFFVGMLILFLDSYFIVSKLKEQTIKEYLKAIPKPSKTKGKGQ
jgi:uncharacterized membrane protein